MSEIQRDFEAEYEVERNKQIVAMGFDPAKLTPDQKDIILEPSEAPENYAQDGEITPAQAKAMYEHNLLRAGFTPAEIVRIKRAHGI